MAQADADLRFIYIDVGTDGRVGEVRARCGLIGTLEENTVHMPPPRSLSVREVPVSCGVVAGEAFGLRPYIMQPLSLDTAG